MSRINNIEKFAKKKEEERVSREITIAQMIEKHKEEIKGLKARIDELVEVANACVNNGIPIEGRAWGGRESYETHHFVSNSWSHLCGFIREYDKGTRQNLPITKVGIIGGGACNFNLKTDGVIVDVSGDEAYVLKRFLESFDTFETEFYKYVDKVTAN